MKLGGGLLSIQKQCKDLIACSGKIEIRIRLSILWVMNYNVSGILICIPCAAKKSGLVYAYAKHALPVHT